MDFLWIQDFEDGVLMTTWILDAQDSVTIALFRTLIYTLVWGYLMRTPRLFDLG